MIVKCIFCQKDFGNVPSLREHSATCADHPAVEECKKLRGWNGELQMLHGLQEMEIERLRVLVKQAYLQGFTDGRYLSRRPSNQSEQAWEESEIKQRLG